MDNMFQNPSMNNWLPEEVEELHNDDQDKIQDLMNDLSQDDTKKEKASIIKQMKPFFTNTKFTPEDRGDQIERNQDFDERIQHQLTSNQSKKKKSENERLIMNSKSLLRQPTGLKKSQVIEEEKEKQVKIEESTTIQKSVNEDVNLKYGDIVYFKFYKELSKGIISGDGIAGNKIECISIGKIINHGSDEYYKYENYDGDIDEENMNGDQKNISSKQTLVKRASLQFRKSLFRVTNSKKYYYHKLFVGEQKASKEAVNKGKNLSQKLRDAENKMKEEEEENQRVYKQKLGTNVIYGQEIQLEHIYSNCVVTLNSEVLANEHCCRELSLEEKPNSWSNFIVGSANNAKKTGEPVMYKEQLTIYSSENPYYWINISQGLNDNQNDQQEEGIFQAEDLFDEGAEVNCTDRSVPIKLCSYLNFQEWQDRQEQLFEQSQQVQAGDIVYIYNRLVKGRVGVIRKSMNSNEEQSQFSMKEVQIELDYGEDSHKKKPINMKVLRVEDYTKNIASQYEFFVDTQEDEERIETLWEIQKVKNFEANLIQFQESIRFKNVWTGLYLYLNLDDDLSLTLEGNLDKTFFNLKPKKAVQLSEKYMQYQMPVKLSQQLQNSTTLFLRCKESLLEQDDDDNPFQQSLNQPLSSILSFRVKKDKRGEVEFEYNKADSKLKQLADRVSSLFPYLMNFYVFLLGWGNRQEVTYKKETWKYEYQTAFNQQKSLYNYVQQLLQSIENLEDFLNEAQTNIQQRQKILLDAGIVEIILLTLKLIHFKLYCHCEIEINKVGESRITDFKAIPDKTPQKIASLKLYRCIGLLYKLLGMCIKGNSECASFVLRSQEDNFLFDQIKFHKNEVVSLLKEATRYVDGDQKEQNIANMKKWISKIQQITQHNLEEQTFIIELLSLSITDHLEKPIREYQNECRKLLFTRPKRVKEEDEEINITNNNPNNYEIDIAAKDKKIAGFLKKQHLLSFKLDKDTPFLVFNLYSQQRQKFQSENPDLFYTGKKSSSLLDDSEINHFPFEHVNGSMVKASKHAIQSSQVLEKYEMYVLEVINLYALLSAGRNAKSIKCLQSIGLTKDYIYACLSSKKLDNNHLRQYRSMLNLYENFILNVVPFVPISSYTNLCFLSDDFKNFDPIKDASYSLFREIIVTSESKQQIKEEYIKLLDSSNANNQEVNENQLLFKYAEILVNRESKGQDKNPENEEQQKNQSISSLGIQEELVNDGPNKNEIIQKLNHNSQQFKLKQTDWSKLSIFMMETFHQMLKILKTRIDLGYNTPQQNKKIMKIIPNIFYALIDFKETKAVNKEENNEKVKQERNFSNYNKNWIYEFLFHNLQYCSDNLITTKVFIETIQISNIIQKLNLYLFVVHKIKEQRESFKPINHYEPSENFFKEFEFQLQQENNEEESVNRSQSSEVYETKQEKIKISVLIFQSIKYLRRDVSLESLMFSTLLKNFDYLKELKEQMMNVEIIEDQYELDLYKEVNGLSDNQNFRSPYDIKILVQKTIQYFQYFENLASEEFFTVQNQKSTQGLLKEEEQKKYDEQMRKFLDLEKHYDQLTIAIEQCNLLFNSKRFMKDMSINSKNSQHLELLQKIFKHSMIPEYLLQTLNKIPTFNSSFIEFYRKIVTFFEFYIKDNLGNKKRILTQMNHFLSLCMIPNDLFIYEKPTEINNGQPLTPIKISKLCIELLLEIKKDQSQIRDIISSIIQLIESSIPFNVEKTLLKKANWQSIKYKIYRCEVNELKCKGVIQYFKILKSLTISEYGASIQPNQLQILNNFMHNKVLSDIVQPIIESYIQKFNVKFTSPNERLRLKLHTTGILLLSACCKDYKIGIQEIQRFIMFDTLKSIVVSSYAPLLLKRAYLKCLFEAYVNKVYDLEKGGSNETISNIELNDILSSEIIPAIKLTTSYVYLEGLIGFKDLQKEQESLNNLRQNIKRKKYNQFKGVPAYDQAIWIDEQQRKKESDGNISYQGIIQDCSEYWKYLFKEGIIHFITDTLDEFLDIGNLTDSDNSSVISNFKIIGSELQDLLGQLEIAEKEFKVTLAESYADTDMLRALLEVIPIGQPKSNGKNFFISIDKVNKIEQVTVLQKNNGEGYIEQKKEMRDEFLNSEDEEIQKQFRLQLLRKRIGIKDFLICFSDQFKEFKSIDRALFEALNYQKICYTSSQVNYIITKKLKTSSYHSKKMEDSKGKNKAESNEQKKGNLRKKEGQNSMDMLAQVKLIAGGLYRLASQTRRQELPTELNLDFLNPQNLNQSKVQGQKVSIDKIKKQFSKSIKKNVKESLNILKRTIIEDEIEIKNKKKKNEYQERSIQLMQLDIDDGIADYEDMSSDSEDEGEVLVKKKKKKKIFGLFKVRKDEENEEQDDDNDSDSSEDPEDIGEIEKVFLSRLMIDSQVTLFLRDIQKQIDVFGVRENENYDQEEEESEEEEEEGYFTSVVKENNQYFLFYEFLNQIVHIFSSQKYYLVKIVRLILEIVQVDEISMKNLTSTDEEEKEAAIYRFELLQNCQKAVNTLFHLINQNYLYTSIFRFKKYYFQYYQVADQELFAYAFKFINVNSTYNQVQEGLTFMICILNKGNSLVQNQVLKYFQTNKDALVDFISYLRHFFNQEISNKIKFMSEEQAFSTIPTQFEILSLKILKLIQLFCENVNEEFQIFLMKQSEDETSLLPSYNIILEVSTFLSIFLEDDTLEMKRKSKIILQCIDTLNEGITGQRKVLECITQNRRMFTYINEKIIVQNTLNLRPPFGKATSQIEKQSLRYIQQDIELFSSVLKFLLTIVSGIPQSKDLQFLIEQLDTKQLIQILQEIYEFRILPKENAILKDEKCNHVSEGDGLHCDENYCYLMNVTPLDEQIIKIGFNIFILFYYLRDIFPDNKEKLMAFYFDEKLDLASTFDSSAKKSRNNRSSNKQIKNKFLSKLNTMKELQLKSQENQVGNFSEKSKVKTEKLSARQLLNFGMTNLILKDKAKFTKPERTKKNQAMRKDGTIKTMSTEIEDEDEEDYRELFFSKKQPYYCFFKEYLGSTEVINQNKKLTRVYFNKPFYSKYLTADIKSHLIEKADRDSDMERILFLLDHSKFYEQQMIHKQRISKWGIIAWLVENWRLCKNLSYYLVIILTIITLATYGQDLQSDENVQDLSVQQNQSPEIKTIFLIASILQLILSVAILFSCAIERYPISINRNVPSLSYDLIQTCKSNAGFKTEELASLFTYISHKAYEYFSPKSATQSLTMRFALILFDFENFYNLIYLAITALSFYNNLIYSFLLLDIVKRSGELQNVISSITTNILNILKFAFLGVIIMYIYGIIGYSQFVDDYDSENGGVADSFILTITSTIKQGLKNGGGIADSMSPVQDPFSKHLWGRYFFDLSFFIVINMLFIQMIFGIILDTFGELRDNRQELMELVKGSCFVCGLQRNIIEASSDQDWYHHIYMEHNCYNLLFYVIYINRKNENDCDALEKYIKRTLDMQDQQQTQFIPIGRSLCMELYKSQFNEGINSEEVEGKGNEEDEEEDQEGEKQIE